VKILSGGQTGADRGGLDAAIDAGVPHCGWCPKGRRAEDGRIPDRYQLVETSSVGYLVRAERNVIESSCTVVFTYGRPTGGSKKTVSLAEKHCRPCLCVDLAAMDDLAAAEAVLAWLTDGGVSPPTFSGSPPWLVLNVAGSRESKAPGIQARVQRVVGLVLRPPFYPRGGE
jgi:hypothetical protein